MVRRVVSVCFLAWMVSACDCGGTEPGGDSGIDATTMDDGGPDAADASDGSDPDAGDAADATTDLEVCGDSEPDPGEVCDDGNMVGGDGCAADCLTVEPNAVCPIAGPCAYCGDGSLRTGHGTVPDEACDDGNQDADDGCSASCEVEGRYQCPNPGEPCELCGDGRDEPNEQCDDGGYCVDGGGVVGARCDADADCASGSTCLPRGGDGCNATCTGVEEFYTCNGPDEGLDTCTRCGDGVVDAASGEVCDDGGRCTGDDMTACDSDLDCAGVGGTCTPRTADGCTLCQQVDFGYVCPPGGGTCARCGDGVLVAGLEECDDANAFANDGCTPFSNDGNGANDCRIEAGYHCVHETGTPVSPDTRSCYRCGDGVRQAGEACDDGNMVAGDGCGYVSDSDLTNDCYVETGYTCEGGLTQTSRCNDCGNGEVEGTEVCDNDQGGSCSGMPSQACVTDADCVGMGVCQGLAGDGCAASCKATEPSYRCVDVAGQNTCFRCGDGHLDVATGEECDDGDNAGGDGCNASCFEENGWDCAENPDGTIVGCARCGDGIVQTPVENCDDRNAVAGDGCVACRVESAEWTCTYSPATFVHLGCADCGDGVVKSGIETCDDANENDLDGCSSVCAVETSVPPWTCTYSTAEQRSVCNRCGDGMVQGPTEVCDDGDTAGSDGCSATCKRLEPGYTCTEGPVNGSGGHDAMNPFTLCYRCGDGIVDPGQTCDDGDAFGGDGCSSTCQLEPGYYGCYDVIADAGNIPETCLRCGDGRVSTGIAASGSFPAVNETCDDGNGNPGDGCSATCSLEGMGYNCFVPGQACVLCGNSIQEVGEGCDDGNDDATDGCSDRCQIEPLWACQNFSAGTPSICSLCGDGMRTGLESCDDGNRASADGCSASCAIEPGYVCSGATCSASLCGDGVRAGSEECDDGNALSNDCCNINCRLERDDTVWSPIPTSGHPYGTCVEAVCGDGNVQGTETCDTGAVSDAACDACQITPGYTCSPSGCTNATCGNGAITGGEQCECDMGGCFYVEAGVRVTLPSAAACTSCVVVDAPGGEAACGNGVVDTLMSGLDSVVEGCDDDNTVSGDGCSSTCRVEPFYVCESQPGTGGAGSCHIGLQFVEVAQYPGVTEVDPTAFWYDPLTRSFVGYKRQGSGDVPMELCLDGTLQEADPDHFRPTLAGSSTTLEGAVYDPGSQNVFFLYDSGGFKLGRVSAQLLRTTGITRNLTGITTLTGPAGTALSDANDAGDITIGEDGRLYVTYLNGSNQIGYDYTIGGGTTSPAGAGVLAYAMRPEGVVDFTGTAVDFIPLPVTVNNSTEPLGALWFVPGWDVIASFTNATYPSPYDPYGSRQVFAFLGYGEAPALQKYCLTTTTGLPTNEAAPVACNTNATCGGTTSTICGYRFDDNYYAQSYLLNNPSNGFLPQGPGPLFRSVTSGHDLADTAGAAATATDGSGFVLCTTNSNTERCRLFSLACTPGPVGDDTCGQNSPGTTCSAQGYCTRAAGANDDYAQFEKPATQTGFPIDVLLNDVVGPAACYNRTKQVVAIGSACHMGVCTPNNQPDQPDNLASVAIGPGGSNIIYTPDPARECGYVDTFLYWARLGNLSSTTPLYDYATVTVVVGCDCGDGVVQSNEQCDPAAPGNVYNCDATTCRIIPTCGNGLVEPGEACDDMDTDNGDGCDATCQLEYACGDGIVDPAFESCDDGNLVAGDGCGSTCQDEGCGDGVTQVALGEQCDNGPTPGNGCDVDCQLVPVCGNALVESGEECDDGAGNGNDEACLEDCRIAWCGDSYVHEGTEECDIGDPMQAQTCTLMCEINECGDGVIFGMESCDPGEANTSSACRDAMAGMLACQLAYCGDGSVDAVSDGDGDPYSNDVSAEACDDGNVASGDGCRADCSLPTCGDGEVDGDSYVSPGVTFVEECDDGNDDETDGCLSTCRIPYCGDGFVGVGEECDTALPPGPNGCDAACQIPNYCGDGELAGMESCDAGTANGTASSACSGVCVLQYCGDGDVDAVSDVDRNPFTPATLMEQCDDGGNTSGDGCSNVCVDEWVCGDGNMDPGEECDDGNTASMDGCTGCTGLACRDTEAPGFQGCKREIICGDGVLQAGTEQCDDGNQTNGDGCSATCVTERCGDGVTQAALMEECDQGGSNGAPGASCTAACKSVVCGNGRVESPYEICDDGNTRSFDGCSATCQIELD